MATVRLLSRIQSTQSALLIRCFEFSRDSEKQQLQNPQPSIRLDDLAHAFRSNGDYNTARTLYSKTALDYATETKANTLGNLSMEYYRIGHHEAAAKFALAADSLYQLMGNYVAQLWTKRLIMLALQRDAPIRAQHYRSQFQLLLTVINFNSSAIQEPFLSDAAVSVLTMYHELAMLDKSGKLNQQAFGRFYNLVSDKYQHLRDNNRNVWSVHSHNSFSSFNGKLPIPIVRSLYTSGDDLPFITTAVDATADSARIALTPIGTYLRSGQRWLLQQECLKTIDDSVVVETVVECPFYIYGFTNIEDGIVVCSKNGVVRYTSTPSGYKAVNRLSIDGEIVAGSMQRLHSGQIGLLTKRHLVIFDLASMKVTSRIDLKANSRKGDISELPLFSSEAGMYQLRNGLLFITSRFGTLCAALKGSQGKYQLIPHRPMLRKGYASQLYQVDRTSIATIDASYQGDTVIMCSDLSNLRSCGYSRGRAIHIAKSKSPHIAAIVSEDRIDVIDRDQNVCRSYVNLPLPSDLDNRETLPHFTVELHGDSVHLEYSCYSTVRRVVFRSQAASLNYRYYTSNTLQTPDSTVPQQIYSNVPFEVSDTPLFIDLASNTVTIHSTLPALEVGKTDAAQPISSYAVMTNSLRVDSNPNSLHVRHPFTNSKDLLILTDSSYKSIDNLVRSLAYITTVIVVSASCVSLYRYRRRRSKLTLEQAKAQQLELLREDMHDMIGSRLVRIASLARRASSKNDPTALDRIHDLSVITVRSLRNLLSLMAESTLDDASFFGSLREYVSESCRDADLDCQVSISVGDSTTLTAAQRHELLMIVSEMLSNTIRHAQATEVTMTVVSGARNVVIEWSDNGIGIDESSARGNGRDNIERRTNRIGARIAMSSNNNGTSYTIDLPIA
jgi:signal transduction histidine kinase